MGKLRELAIDAGLGILEIAAIVARDDEMRVAIARQQSDNAIEREGIASWRYCSSLLKVHVSHEPHSDFERKSAVKASKKSMSTMLKYIRLRDSVGENTRDK